MDPLAAFALTIGMVIAASQQAAVMEQYAAAARSRPAAPVQIVAPEPAVPGWAAGAALGAQVGALASAANPTIRCSGRACGLGYDARPMIAGALIGGLAGHAASNPPPVIYARAPEAAAPVVRRAGAGEASRDFTEHWQQFMQPSVSRARQN